MHDKSGWPSGLSARLKLKKLATSHRGSRAFWSTNVGVGSNPTPDRAFRRPAYNLCYIFKLGIFFSFKTI